MLYQFPLVALALGFTPIAQAGPTFPRQATAGAFDCEQVRVDSPNTTFSGFIAADLDSERRYVVTKTASQKRLLTRFENNTLFTLNGNGKNPTFGATFGFYWDTPPGKPNFAASAQNYAYFNSVAASKLGDKPAKIAASINEAGTNPSTEDAPAIHVIAPSPGRRTRIPDRAADLSLMKDLRAELRVNAAIQVAVDSLEFAEGQLRIVKEVSRLKGGSKNPN
ncbi:hypothetical protein B0T18DRAFT_428208 [Schizothecium vesticola]|uniref:Uncharacterized protein n=1 Tax=Schizothecium vesticola TaxID=314040 RepID=A0AA40F306_9PEZI|nr:hypothetical protein B0T18DRAFT_428208 [Schizothecium vesticola]